VADSQKLLSKLTAHAGQPRPEAEPKRPEDDEQHCNAFGYLRGVRERALLLELRFRDGNAEAFTYSWLGRVSYVASAGLLLRFNGDRLYWVLVEGANLNKALEGGVSLYQKGLLRHRVTWVREMSAEELSRAGPGDVTVEHIRVASSRPEEGMPQAAWLAPFSRRLEGGGG
jgi:hypothetical protein